MKALLTILIASAAILSNAQKKTILPTNFNSHSTEIPTSEKLYDVVIYGCVELRHTSPNTNGFGLQTKIVLPQSNVIGLTDYVIPISAGFIPSSNNFYISGGFGAHLLMLLAINIKNDFFFESNNFSYGIIPEGGIDLMADGLPLTFSLMAGYRFNVVDNYINDNTGVSGFNLNLSIGYWLFDN